MPRTKATKAVTPRAQKAVKVAGDGRTGQTGMVRARVAPQLKADAEEVLDRIGLNPSDAIRIYYKQIVMAGGLPFPVTVPNAETRRAIEDADAGRVTRYGSAAEMFKKLGL